MKKLKPFLIVVHNDLDGGTSAVVIINHIKEKYGKTAKYKLAFKTYTNINEYIERVMDDPYRFEKVFIADISCEQWLAEQFPKNFILLDHHDTAIELQQYDNCHVDVTGKHSGASICFKTLILDENLPYSKELKQLVAIAHDYDLWIHKLPKRVAKNLNFIYYYYWGEEFCERFENGFDRFNDEEKRFLKSKWEGIERQIEEGEYIDLLEEEGQPNKICLFLNTKKFVEYGDVNEVCGHAIEKLGYHVVICATPKNKKLSLRASEHAENCGLNVGEIARELYESGYGSNGGGRARTGGAGYVTEDNLEMFCQVFCEKIIEYKI